MPIFASLNAVSPGAWTSYAKARKTGIAGLEINYYVVATVPMCQAATSRKRCWTSWARS